MNTNVNLPVAHLRSQVPDTHLVRFSGPGNVVWIVEVPTDHMVIPVQEYNALSKLAQVGATQAPTETYKEKWDKMFKKFHATGTEVYGRTEWDTMRPNIVGLATGGQHYSSTNLDLGTLKIALDILEAIRPPAR